MKTARDHVDEGVRLFLVLDFDGVLNQFPSMAQQWGLQGGFQDWKRYIGTIEEVPGFPFHYPLHVSEALVEGLNRILARPEVQLVWLTTWKTFIAKPAREFGLRSLRPPTILDFHFSQDLGSVPGKLRAFEEYFKDIEASEGLSVVWADDEAVSQVLTSLRRGWPATSQRLLGAFSQEARLLLDPASLLGLTPEHLQRAEAFVAGRLEGWGEEEPFASDEEPYPDFDPEEEDHDAL